MTNQSVEALRNQQLDMSNFKVIGRDQVPAGIKVTPTQVIFEKYHNDFIDWKIGPRSCVWKCQTGHVSGVHSKGARSRVALLDIWPGCGPTGFERFQLEGGYGAGDVPMVLKQRFTGDGRAIKIGLFPLMQNGVLLGFGRDALKFAGDLKGQLFRRIYIGPQHAVPNTKPHFDGFTSNAGLGGVTMDEVLLDMVDPPPPAVQIGTNNGWRFVTDAKKTGIYPAVDMLRVQNSVLLHGLYNSEMIQVGGGRNFVGPVEFLDNWFGGDMNKVVHPASNTRIMRWVNNREIGTGKLIAAPPGARAA